MKHSLINGYDDKAKKNVPWYVEMGSEFRIRIWQNDLGEGRSQLKGDICHNLTGSCTPSLPYEPLDEIHRILGRALKKMRRHRRQQAWKHVLFPWF